MAPRPAVSAFLSGFYELIPRTWVSMFSGEELQTLISGADSALDLADLQQHVEYAGGYHPGERGQPGKVDRRRLGANTGGRSSWASRLV